MCNSKERTRKEERIKGLQNSQKAINKIALISPYQWIIAFNANRSKFSNNNLEWMKELKKKQHPIICCLQETQCRLKDTENKGIEKFMCQRWKLTFILHHSQKSFQNWSETWT